MKQDRKKAIFIAEKIFAELVFDVQKLEGMPFTLPEIQTYLQGITVGGHKVTDEDKLKQQILGWKHLISLVKTGAFALTQEIACSIQRIIARDEALEIGRFRSGRVGIAGTEYVPPLAEELDKVFTRMLCEIRVMKDVREQAFRVHLDFARNQFFYDGNKRTGLLMCCGHLMHNGYPPVSIPAKRLSEYNAGMIRLYDSGDPAEMTAFLRECHDSMYARFE